MNKEQPLCLNPAKKWLTEKEAYVDAYYSPP